MKKPCDKKLRKALGSVEIRYDKKTESEHETNSEISVKSNDIEKSSRMKIDDGYKYRG